MAPFVYTAGPHTALIKSSGRKDVRVVIGGRMFAIPIFQRVDRLGLELRTIKVHTTRGTTINGVGVDVTSCCQVKIQGWSTTPEGEYVPAGRSSPAGGDLHMDYSAIRLAAQHFIGKKDHEIEGAIQETIAGHQRAIIGVLTVEELYRDRERFSKRVLDLCYNDMRNMGLTIVSYTVAEITDEHGYIEALGVTQTELVKREATEGKAVHESKARSRKAQEDAAAHLEVNKQLELKIESDKLRAVKQAEAQQEIDRKVAVQKKVFDITNAEEEATLFVERQKAKAAEAEAELSVMKQKVEKERLVKQQMVHVEADAMLYKAQVDADSIKKSAEAEADKTTIVGKAKADAVAIMIKEQGLAKADADALYLKQKGQAEADVIRAKGMAEVDIKLAEAKAIREKGMAEVDVLRERLKMWKECGNQGIIMEKIIEQLPNIAGAIAAPLSKTEKMVFVGSGGSGGGPSAFTKEMNRIMAEVPETVNALTGIDLSTAVSQFANSTAGTQFIAGCAEGGASELTKEFMTKRK